MKVSINVFSFVLSSTLTFIGARKIVVEAPSWNLTENIKHTLYTAGQKVVLRGLLHIATNI